MHIRWMIRRDMGAVLDIENAVFEYPWDEEELTKVLRERNQIGMVLERNDAIHGYMVYGLLQHTVEILNLAVHPDYRRHGLGTALVDKLKGKLSTGRRVRLAVNVRETNLEAQLFFRELGFRAVRVVRDLYDDCPDAAYRMEYRLLQPEYDEAAKLARAV